MTDADGGELPAVGGSRQPRARGSLKWLVIPIVLGAGYLLVGLVALHPGKTNCNDTAPERARIAQLVTQGQPDVAAGLADLALSQSDTCDSAKPALATLEYRSSMQDLYRHPELDGPQAVERWQLAQIRAQPYGIAVDSPLVVADDADHAGLWEFARFAFQQAWLTSQDPSNVPLYYSILRSGGTGLLQSDGPGAHDAGLRELSTACQVAIVYALAQQQACVELDQDVGPDAAGRPPPQVDDVVLQSAAQAGAGGSATGA